MLRHCPKCSLDLELSAFNKDKSTSSGLATWCRGCCKAKNSALYRADRPRRLARQKELHEASRGHNIERMKARYRSRPDEYKRAAIEWWAQRPELKAIKDRLRGEAQKRAMPKWADRDAMAAVYRERDRLTAETGIEHEVDHIIPIQSKVVCGLHWEGNLQVLTAAANGSKGNKMILLAA